MAGISKKATMGRCFIGGEKKESVLGSVKRGHPESKWRKGSESDLRRRDLEF